MKVIKFYATWCGPCKALEKNLQECNIPHESIDIDSQDGEALSVKYNIRSVPTLLVVDDNEEVLRRKVGNMPVDELTKFIYEAN